jgi:hypothetical protein
MVRFPLHDCSYMMTMMMMKALLVNQKLIAQIRVHAQDSYACTALLYMHNALVHALEGPGPKAGTQWPR